MGGSFKVEELCTILQEKQKTVETFREQYEKSNTSHKKSFNFMF